MSQRIFIQLSILWICYLITQVTLADIYKDDTGHTTLNHVSEESNGTNFENDTTVTQMTVFPEGIEEQTTKDSIIVIPNNTQESSADKEKFPTMDTMIELLDSNVTSEVASPYRAACECGRPTSRIVGGEVARISDYPWTAALTRGGNHPYCGGTLIADRIVVTASHCVDGMSASGIKVILNQQYVSSPGSSQRFSVTSIRMHPNYDRSTVNNDIAILQISPPVSFDRTNQIVPACVVGSKSIDFTGAYATVVGFGSTSEGGSTSDVLRKVTIPVISFAECDSSRYRGRITENMLCAGNLRNGGQDSCQGDSGGPLIIENGGRRTLIGIVSWGYGCAQPNSPGVYTKVQNYGNWILANTQGSIWCRG